jgi:hypothetical protein
MMRADLRRHRGNTAGKIPYKSGIPADSDSASLDSNPAPQLRLIESLGSVCAVIVASAHRQFECLVGLFEKFDLRDEGSRDACAVSTRRVYCNADPADVRRVVLSKNPDEGLGDRKVGRHGGPRRRSIDAHEAAASVMVSTREGLVGRFGLAEIESDEIRAIRNEKRSAGMSLLAEENIDHDSFASDSLLIRGAGWERIDAPFDANPGIVLDIRLIEKKSESARFGFEPERVVRDRIDDPPGVACILLWGESSRPEPFQNGSAGKSREIDAVDDTRCRSSLGYGQHGARDHEKREEGLACHATCQSVGADGGLWRSCYYARIHHP